MALYDKFTSKQKRIIRQEIAFIISVKGFTFPKSSKEFLDLSLFSPKIKIGNKQAYFSERGQKSLRVICNIIYETKEYDNLLNYDDIHNGIISEIQRWLSNDLHPDDKEFIFPLENILNQKIDLHNFVCRVDGIKLDDIDKISIGSRIIKTYTEELLSEISDNVFKSKDIIKKEYEDKVVIIGKERGSKNLAEDKYFHNAKLSLSILSLYSYAFHENGIQQIRIRLVNDCSHSYGLASCFGWSDSKSSLYYKKYFKTVQDVPYSSENLDTLKHHYFFDEVFSLIDKENRDELEESILKSLYWLGETQNDLAYASKWLKFWSCLECFFTLDKNKITEKNARGISSILIHGGYNHPNFNNYKKLKSKIKYFYKLRSKIAHRADYTHIKACDLRELTLIVAWVIITIVALSNNGCTSLTDIMNEADRLDGIENKRIRLKKNGFNMIAEKIMSYLKWIHKR